MSLSMSMGSGVEMPSYRGAGVLLMETGDALLLENDDKILLEGS